MRALEKAVRDLLDYVDSHPRNEHDWTVVLPFYAFAKLRQALEEVARVEGPK